MSAVDFADMESGQAGICNKTFYAVRYNSINWQQTENSDKIVMIIIKITLSLCPVIYVKNWTNISLRRITRRIKSTENKTNTSVNFLLDLVNLKEFYK